MTLRIKLWDLPTRLFHWLLVLGVASAWASGEAGGNWMIWHARIGLLIIGLIAFRIVWGFVGSTYARFATFVRGPAAIAAHLRGGWQGVGHNPLGALSVLGLLAIAATQGGTGLFAFNDDLGFGGPLYAAVSGEISTLLTRLHHKTFDLLLILVALHVGAIVYYVRVKKDNLLKPMLTGWKASSIGRPASGGGIAAFVLALAIAGLAVFGASGVWLPPPPAATAAPAW